MIFRPHLRCAQILLATLLAAPAAAQAAAIVGEPQHVALPPPPAADARADFRRPDTITFPDDNLYTPAKARLGRMLFFDPRLSRANVQSCSSCHNPALGYGDGLSKGMGDGMHPLGRRSPTIVNAAWSDALMWDGRFDTLEAQALGPIQSPGEMNMALGAVVDRLGAVAEYRKLFEAAFPGQPMSGKTIGSAIATYERTIVSSPAPFDAWVDGDEAAVSDAAKRGFAVFTGKANCVACHSGWTFSDNGFHDVGLPDDDIARGKFFPQILKMQHAFKTPTLREINRRAPYMHDGSLPTLEAVVAHYDSGGVARASRSELVKPLGLTDTDKSDLVAFMQTLSSQMPPAAAPNLPR